MYCQLEHGGTIDHFEPRAMAPGRTFDWANLLLACAPCQGFKLDHYPVDPVEGRLLVDPSVDQPSEHLKLLPTSGRYKERTRRGEASIRYFGLNEIERPRRRRELMLLCMLALVQWGQAMDAGNRRKASRLGRILSRPYFWSILRALLRAARNPHASFVFEYSPATRDVLLARSREVEALLLA